MEEKPILEQAHTAVSHGLRFIGKQNRDWIITAARSSIFRFLYQMVLPYLSIYTLALGATGTQLGIVNAIGMAVAGLLSPFTGWMLDIIGPKKIYLVGIGLLAISWFLYSVAQNWPIIIIAMLAYWIGFRTSTHSCSVICANSLAPEDRVTAMSCCETLAAGMLGLLAPMAGALIVTSFGGVTIKGIRPLFYISLIGTLGTFLLILTQLSNRRWKTEGNVVPSLLRDLSQVFKGGRNLKRFLLISSATHLPYSMLIPFTQPFAHEFKGADEFVLGAMVTGFALTPLLLGIPVGRLADRIGRKRVIYLIAPFFWASSLMLVWSPSPVFLIVAGILQGFFFINTVITGAMAFELVPAEQMGRWTGIIGFFRMLIAAGAAYLAGAIWDNIGPQYLFLVFIGLDMIFRISPLLSMPETLDLRTKN